MDSFAAGFAVAFLALTCVLLVANVVLVATRQLVDATLGRILRGAPKEEVPGPREYEINGETFYSVKVTRPVMEAVIEAHYEPRPPEPDQLPAFLFGQQQPSKEDMRGRVESTYLQLSLLLVDREGEHPGPEFLGVYVDVGDATRMVWEIMP
jgi:hypothetical protein